MLHENFAFSHNIMRLLLNGESKEKIDLVLKAHLHLLNDDFAQWLRDWVANELSKPEERPGEKQFMAIFIANHLRWFSQIVQNFPEGNHACNIEIAIAGYESALKIYTKEQFPEEWAAVQINLGSAYAVRAKGNKAQNAMREIACYEQALSVFTPEHDKEVRALTLNNLGAVYLDSSQNTPAHIHKAISYFAEALRTLRDHSESPEFKKALKYWMVAKSRKSSLFPTPLELEMAQAQSSRGQYLQSGDLQALERSVAIWERIISNPDFDKVDEGLRLATLNDSAITFMCRYHHTKNELDLRRALSHWHELEEKLPPDLLISFYVLNGLGNYHYLYDHTHNPEYLDQAITFLLKKSHDIQSNTGITFHDLGMVWRKRYLHSGSLSDLKNAITAYQQALALIDNETASALDSHHSNDIRSSCYNNLGNALRDYSTYMGELTVLEEAITAFEQAVELSHEARPHDRAFRLTNLGTGLRRRYWYTKKPQDIQRAIQLFEEAVSITPIDSPYLHLHLNNLGRGFDTRYRLTLNPVDLGEAIKYFMQAINSAPHHAENDRTVYLVNLGEALTQQSISTNNRFFWQEAKKLFRDASQKGLNLIVGETLRSMSTWLTTAFLYEEWQEVIEAYRFFYQGSQQVLKIQLVRTDKEMWLRQMQGLSAKAAVAFAKLNDLPQAVTALEYARAFLLSEALERERTDLARLPELGHADLHQEYQTTLNQILVLEKQQQVDLERLRQARIKLDNTIEQIREVEGYQDFLRLQPDFEKDIMPSLSQNPTAVLVYTAVTPIGGLALIVQPNGQISPLWLDKLTEDALQDKMLLLDEDRKLIRGYQGAYFDWQDNPRDDATRNAWLTALDEMTRWLWDVLMGPLVRQVMALSKDKEVILIPQSWLNMLPLHAAWTEDLTTPTGRRYAFDTIGFTYAPNARALNAARQKANIRPNALFAVDNPDGSLRFSAAEVAAARTHFQNEATLHYKTATRQAVQDALPDYSVLHFSTHGWAGWNDPLSGGLLLANGTQITLRDLFALRLDKARLAVLSACETGIPGAKLLDEVVSLPTGLMLAGVPCVVASLWSVPDISTALLMQRFYHNHQKGGMDFVEALHEAQKWVREIQIGEVAKYAEKCYQQFKWSKKAEVELFKLMRNYQYRAQQDPNERPFAHPYYWAAFTVNGM